MKLIKSLKKGKSLNDDTERIIKICLLGDANVGKSTITQRIKYDSKKIQHITTSPTIGASFSSVRRQLRDLNIVFHVWDTAGQEKFHSMVPFYMRNTQIFIIVFDLTDKSSFDNVFNRWIPLVEEYIKNNYTCTNDGSVGTNTTSGKYGNNKNIPPRIMIVGNKNDKISKPDYNNNESHVPYKEIAERITHKFPNKMSYTSISALNDASDSIIKKCFDDSFELYYDENNGDIFTNNISNKFIDLNLDIEPGSGCLAGCIIF
jgi:small GTP-binding protein